MYREFELNGAKYENGRVRYAKHPNRDGGNRFRFLIEIDSDQIYTND